jgi:hypothetical protein
MKQLKSSGYKKLRHDASYPNPDYHNKSFLFNPEVSINDEYKKLLRPKDIKKLSQNPIQVNAVKALLRIGPHDQTYIPTAKECLYSTQMITLNHIDFLLKCLYK